MSCLLLVDFSSLVWKASAVHPYLSHRGEFTGGLYGVISQISTAILAVNATRLAICVDSPPYFRLQAFPTYKGDRGGVDEALVVKVGSAKHQCNELFLELGVPVWRKPGLEADDMIAWGVELHRRRFDHIIAASNDSDLYQLFRHACFSMYRGRRGEYTRQDFNAEFPELDPLWWSELSAMTGTHNRVPGLPGVGPKTALKIMRDPNRLQEIWAKHRDILERNRELIRLPWRSDCPSHLPYVPQAPFSPRRFVNFAARYGITITSPMMEAFDRVCNG